MEPAEGIHQVQLVGLPNEILSDMMFRAVLQQAQLNGSYSSFTTSPGKNLPWGEAVIDLVSDSAAQWCCYHFHGRSWMADGTEVIATLLTPSSFEQDAALEPLAQFDETWLESLAMESAWFQSACAMESLAMEGLSFDSLAYSSSCAAAGGLSAEAPVFVPGMKSMGVDNSLANNSDVSTVDGESESDEDKVAVEVVAC
jgi:hypothetical protein